MSLVSVVVESTYRMQVMSSAYRDGNAACTKDRNLTPGNGSPMENVFSRTTPTLLPENSVPFSQCYYLQ
jgi:hypothetical protein